MFNTFRTAERVICNFTATPMHKFLQTLCKWFWDSFNILNTCAHLPRNDSGICSTSSTHVLTYPEMILGFVQHPQHMYSPTQKWFWDSFNIFNTYAHLPRNDSGIRSTSSTLVLTYPEMILGFVPHPQHTCSPTQKWFWDLFNILNSCAHLPRNDSGILSTSSTLVYTYPEMILGFVQHPQHLCSPTQKWFWDSFNILNTCAHLPRNDSGLRSTSSTLVLTQTWFWDSFNTLNTCAQLPRNDSGICSTSSTHVLIYPEMILGFVQHPQHLCSPTQKWFWDSFNILNTCTHLPRSCLPEDTSSLN